mgnify:CR=1 FL=1
MKKRMTAVMPVGIVMLLAICLFALLYGSYEMSLGQIFKTIFYGGTPSEHVAVWGIRLPRILVSIFIGVALSASGCTMQGVTRNPLAEPGIIGINAGATLAVVLYIANQSTMYYSALGAGTLIFTPLISMLGAFAAAGLIYGLAYKKGDTGRNRLILVGVGINIAISSVVVLFQLSMNKGSYNQALTWTNGSLWGTGFLYLAMIAPVTVIIFAVLIYKSRTLDVLSLGDEIATGLGIAVEKERKKFLFLAVLLASAAVAVAGNIAFVGLIGPHIAQKLVGAVHRRKLPAAAVISACLVVLADTLARNLFSPVEIPLGILLSLIGVPYFIYLMIRER